MLFEDFAEPSIPEIVKPSDPTNRDYDLYVKIYMADYKDYKDENVDLKTHSRGYLTSSWDIVPPS